MTYYVLTGCTGLLGRYLLRHLLPRDVPLAVLIRGNRVATARERLETVVGELEEQLGYVLPRPVLLDGDLTAPGLGLSRDERSWISRNVRGVLHNAASLTFDNGEPHEEPWRTNLDGTKNLLELARELKLREFHHVSTAYVCGRRRGQILESQLDEGQEFGNDYERSKFQAEQLINRASWLGSRTIYRPAIIVGDSRTGYTNTFHGFYTPLRIAHMLINSVPLDNLQAQSLVHTLGLTGEERKNLVPVDWVAAVIGRLFENPAHHGEVYHVTPEERVQASLLCEVMEQAVTQHSVQWNVKGEAASTPAPSLSVADFLSSFRERMQVYQAYWRDDPQFDATNRQRHLPHLECPVLSRELLTQLCRFAIQANFWSSKGDRNGQTLAVEGLLAAASRREVNAQVCLSDDIVQLRVLGPGGGDFTFQLDGGEPVACEAGVGPMPHLTVILTSETLQAIQRGRTSWKQAVQQGKIVVENCPAGEKQLEEALSVLLSPRYAFPVRQASA